MHSRAFRLAKVAASVVLGLGLACGLLWAMTPRSAVGALGATSRPVDKRIIPEENDDGSTANDTPLSAPGSQPPRALSDRHIRLEKNEGYYDAASVAITQVNSLFIDEEEAWARYQSGELDTIAPPDSALDTIKGDPTYSPQLHTYASGYTDYYGFSTDVAPFDNPLVRAAFASAIDRSRVISEALNGNALPALTFTPPGSFGHVDGYAAGIGRPYSPTLAYDLLDASGYTGVPTITLMHPASSEYQSVAETIRQMWIETLGITVAVEELDRGSYYNLLQNGSAEERPGIVRLGWGADYPDAHNFHVDGFAWGGRLIRYESPPYDALLDASTAEMDQVARLHLYEQAEAMIVMTDTAIAPLYYDVNHRLARPDLMRTYRAFGQRVDEWAFTGDARPLTLVWGEPNTLDPALVAYESAARDHIGALFVGLTNVDSRTGEVLPELATGWEASADATVFTFTLRTDASWTDGHPVTADDVEYGVLRSLDPNTQSGYPWVLYIIENAQGYNDGSITDPGLVGVEALDASHIRFTLESPAAYFPAMMSLPPARPQPQWAIEAHGSAWVDPTHIVTNGPYKLAHQDHSPNLRIEKQADADPLAGSTYAFTIKYRNDGGAAAEDCVITDTMTGGLTYITDTSGFPHTGSGSGPIIWDMGTLAAYNGGEFQVRVQVTASAGQEVTNKAQIATSDPNDKGDHSQKDSQVHKPVVGSYMYVNYGQDHVGGRYPVGHMMWITVTDSSDVVKATALTTTSSDGAGSDVGWADGFETQGSDWSPGKPDIQPRDGVHFRSDDGYSNTVRVGIITGDPHPDADTIGGTVAADWLGGPLTGRAGTWGFTWRDFTVDPAGGPYFVDFSPENLLPGMEIGVQYDEPDGDRVINVFTVPWPWQLYLPLTLRNQ